MPEGGARALPALVLLTTPVGYRDTHVVEEDLAEGRPAGQVAQRPNLDAGLVHVDQQVADAVLTAVRLTGPPQREHHVAEIGLRAPDLLAVDDVVVTIAAGCGPQGRQVAAGVRLTEPLGPQFIGPQHRPQEPLPLRLGAVLDDRGPTHGNAVARRVRHPGAGPLLLLDALLGERQVHAAVLLRPARAGVAAVEERRHPVSGPP